MEDPCIKRKEVQNTIKMIISQLYRQHGTEQSDNVITDSQEILEDIEDVLKYIALRYYLLIN